MVTSMLVSMKMGGLMVLDSTSGIMGLITLVLSIMGRNTATANGVVNLSIKPSRIASVISMRERMKRIKSTV